MSAADRIRGWCPTCGGPLWRGHVAGCRLCWLEDEAEAHAQRWSVEPGMVVAILAMADAPNSTERTAATSMWTPPLFSVDDDGRAEKVRRRVEIVFAGFGAREEARLSRWLAVAARLERE